MRIQLQSTGVNSCKLTRPSIITGTSSTLEINAPANKILAWFKNPEPLIQDAFPDLTADEREFIRTGITPEQWDTAIAEDEPEETTPQAMQA